MHSFNWTFLWKWEIEYKINLATNRRVYKIVFKLIDFLDECSKTRVINLRFFCVIHSKIEAQNKISDAHFSNNHSEYKF